MPQALDDAIDAELKMSLLVPILISAPRTPGSAG